MTSPTFMDFQEAALREGFDEVAERVWAADTIVPEHRHDFAVHARVVQGEMWLTCADSTLHLKPGDRFALERGQPHAERYGAEGATYWVARRNPTAALTHPAGQPAQALSSISKP